ncbi:MAG: DUF2269 domain-containing protein [Actinomycetota bacterium]|nr:DUF2269 domain-containing protein [Actinomycetota bacterium]MDH5225345.1 DUF2269 domain-containing protein [Actinomycetota bacterium]MDH5313840.1 DUF2269 domain-containing protein [Actinomycetota bacterium]
MRTLLLVLHVLGAVIALGFSLSYRLWVRRGEADGVHGRAFALRTVSWIDRRITTPAFIAQLVTGLLLVATIDWELLRQAWLEISLGIYVLLTALAVTVYAPSFRRQREIAEAIADGTGDEADYAAAASKATSWGIGVTTLTLVIVVLMVWKPALWN